MLQEPVGDVLRRALWLDAVDRQLRSRLAPPLARHVRLVDLAQKRLSLRAQSPAWAHRARLEGDQILHAARSIGLEVERVEVRLATAGAPPPRRTSAEKPPSAASRAAMEEALRVLDGK
ncbi:DciA family protein [Luteimonas sp. e5]